MAKAKSALDYMSPIPLEVPVDTPVVELIAKMVEARVRIAVIVDTNRNLQGIITGGDLIRHIAYDVQSKRLLEGVAKQIMTPTARLGYVTEDAPMTEVAELFSTRRFHSIIVVHGFVATGFVEQVDVLRWWSEDVKK